MIFNSHSITYYVCWKYFGYLNFVVLVKYEKFFSTKIFLITASGSYASGNDNSFLHAL